MQPQKRHWSRRLALQALYQWQLGGHTIDELLEQYIEDENWSKVDTDYFADLIRESINQNKLLIAKLAPYLDIPDEQIDPVEKAILLIATYELMHKTETPTKVIISEAINLSKKFGSADSYKFVNGVLDKVATLRSSS